MSKIFVARQPIFDKKMNLYGYELFYQNGLNHDAASDQESAKLIDGILYEEFDDLIDRKRGFISFSEKLFLAQVPLMFPKDRLIIEISQSVRVTDDLQKVCGHLKNMGYTLALCGFKPEEHATSPLLPYVDIIKAAYSPNSIPQQKQLVKNYRNKVMLVAENLESSEDFQTAANIGYHLFQGFFYSEPVITNAQTIGSLSNILVLVINELGKPEPDYGYIEKLFESDVEMTYKLLRLANSVFFGSRYVISSIRQALVHIGTQKLVRWCHLMLIKGIANAKNEELVKASLIRGKLLSLLADRMQRPQDKSDYFIAGIFSSIDVLLGENISKITERLPLSDQVRSALLGEEIALRNWLDAIAAFEKTEWTGLESLLCENSITKDEFMAMYTAALRWCLETTSFS